ncbi:MAG: iron ABC transporter permease [Planctomycetes bacterium]|nr:iron ABC transporter permease [Planctomycetota bacterium]
MNRRRAALALALLAAVIAALLSLTLGRHHIPPAQVLSEIVAWASGSPGSGSAIHSILFEIRLPRICAACVIGASLAMSGAAFQGLFRNPMVSSDMLGASAGAGFGAALAILLGGHPAVVQTAAFACGLLAVGVASAIGHAVARGSSAGMIALVLAGVLVSTLFSAGIAATKFCADPTNTLPAITFWLMGGLSDVRGSQLAWLLPLSACGAIPLLLLRHRLDIMCFGDDEARSLGIDVSWMRPVIVLCATLLTTASVALCGMIGFVGLVIPHLARLLVGARHADVLPVSCLLGSVFLLGVDDVARCAFPLEVPLGILCSLIGAPFFLWLLVRGRRGWQ